MTSGEKINKGMSLVMDGISETLNNMVKEFVKAWERVKPAFCFLDKKITKKKFMKLLQSHGIQRNQINQIIKNNKEPYTLKLVLKYVSKED